MLEGMVAYRYACMTSQRCACRRIPNNFKLAHRHAHVEVHVDVHLRTYVCACLQVHVRVNWEVCADFSLNKVHAEAFVEVRIPVEGEVPYTFT